MHTFRAISHRHGSTANSATSIPLDDIEEGLWWLQFIEKGWKRMKIKTLRETVDVRTLLIALGAKPDDNDDASILSLAPGLCQLRGPLQKKSLHFDRRATQTQSSRMSAHDSQTTNVHCCSCPPVADLRDGLLAKLTATAVIDAQPETLASIARIGNAEQINADTDADPDIGQPQASDSSMCNQSAMRSNAPLAPQLARTLTGHSGWINCVGLSANGKLVVSASEDSTARVTNATTGQLLQTFTNHFCGVLCVALFSNGTRAVTGSGINDCTVRIWRLSDAMQLWALTGHKRAVWSVAVSPDDATVASASADHSIKLWNVRSGECDATLTKHTKTVNCVAFSADGRTLASGSCDNSIRLWSMRSRSLVRTIRKAHTDWVTAVAFGSEWLVSGSQDKTVKVWRWQSGVLITALTGHAGAVTCVAVFPGGGDRVASGSRDGSVRIWNVHSGECQYTLTDHTDTVTSVAVSRDERTLLSSSKDKSVKVWTLP